MQKQMKIATADALTTYFQEMVRKAEESGQSFSQRELATKIGISPSYIGYLLNHDFDFKNGAGNIVLTDNIFAKVEMFLGLTKDVWSTVNFKAVQLALMQAKRNHEQRIIDGLKGSGKTFAVEEFARQYPKNTYVVTCSSDMNPKQFLYAMGKAVGLEPTSLGGSRYDIRIRVAEKLLSVKDPILIVDEAENATNSVVGSFKDLYDYKALHRHVSIVIVGANDFVDTLTKKALRQNQHSYPQFLSRFGAEPLMLRGYDKKEGADICRKYYQIADEEVIHYMVNKSQDYRQLDKLIKGYLHDMELFNQRRAS